MEPFLVHRSRWKLLTLGIGSSVIAVIGIVAGVDTRSIGMLLGSLGFAFFAFFAFREGRKREPAIVIDDAGIEDRRLPLRLDWEEVEGVRLRRRWRGNMRQTWLLLQVRDIDSVVARMKPGIGKRIGRLDAKLGVNTIFFVLNMLAVRPARVLEAIRARYGGPVG